MIYGYVRVSTQRQAKERQVKNIAREYPDAAIYSESYTGTKIDRPAFSKLLQQLQEGDTIVFDEVSRMSRNAAEGFSLYRELYEKGVNLVFLKEPHINTDVYRSTAQAPLTGTKDLDETLIKGLNEYLMRLAEKQIQIAFGKAQAEVDLLHQRTSEGMIAAGATNKYTEDERGNKILEKRGSISASKIGKTLITKKSVKAKEIIKKHNRDFEGTLTDTETIKLIGCARGSFYKYKMELRQEMGA